MDYALEIFKKIIPEGIEILQRRYQILKGIESYQSIGRRQLSQVLNLTERIVRNEVEMLKKYSYIEVLSSGMILTDDGRRLIIELEVIMYHLKELSGLELLLMKKMKCNKVVVVPGDSDEQEHVKVDIGKAAAEVLISCLKEKSIVSITGGSTVYHVVHSIKKTNKKFEKVLVLPARGSLGNQVEFQANTLVETLAKKIGADYKLLNIPDNLSSKALASVRQEPDIQQIIEKILKTDIVLYGIGNAKKMARRRKLTDPLIDFINRKEAVAEALGYYLDKNGKIVYTSRSIGIKLEEMTNLTYPIAVAGGKSKAESIIAVRHLIKKGCLVIDEGAAKEIIKLINI